MKYSEFKNALSGGEERAVYLFEGEDAYFRERGLSLLKNKFVENTELNFAEFNGDAGANEISASLAAYPFMSRKRLTVVREFYPKKDFIKGDLKAYLENPSADSVLAVLDEKACEALKKFASVTVVDCGKGDPATLMRWVRAECGNNRVNIEGEAAKTLIEYCSSDMTRIDTETRKMIAYAGEGGNITKAEVDELVHKTTEYKIYELTDFIGRRKFDKALEVIDDMASKGETMPRIATSVYNYFRRLLHAAIGNKTMSQLEKAYGVQNYAARKICEQAKMFKKRSLKRAVDRLTDADYLGKSGLRDGEEAAWIALFGIIADK